MSHDNQYKDDRDRLAELLERHTKIPRQRIINFIEEYGVEQILPCANILCATNAQRQKLEAVFEFKNAYEQVKHGDKDKVYKLGSRSAVMEYFCNYFADTKDKEYFVAAYLNTMHELITTKTISMGSLNSSGVYPREIIKEALFCNANEVIVAHNHPSGGLEPSVIDLDVTLNLRESFNSTGIDMLDHIIVAGDRAISLEDPGNIYSKAAKPDVASAVAPISEKAGKSKLTGIKEQLAQAEKQVALDAINNTKKITKDRRDR